MWINKENYIWVNKSKDSVNEINNSHQWVEFKIYNIIRKLYKSNTILLPTGDCKGGGGNPKQVILTPF